MKRIEILKEIARNPLIDKRRVLLVSNIGYCSRELFSIANRPGNFYMLGSMGLASSIGLGVALAQRKREVIVLDGDASILMNLGTLSTIANFAPRNFHLVIVDNKVNGSTGGQNSNTSLKTDLAEMARSAGVQDVRTIRSRKDLKRPVTSLVTVVECEPSNENVPKVSLKAKGIRRTFMRYAQPV